MDQIFLVYLNLSDFVKSGEIGDDNWEDSQPLDIIRERKQADNTNVPLHFLVGKGSKT
jgi:hypothetical protein